MTAKSPGRNAASGGGKNENASSIPEHDQDSDPPRTAVPPDSTRRPGETSGSTDPDHDQDSDPPRTAVPPND
jgi:hypothetical protein